MRPILVTSGEPAGVGPDLCLALARYELPLVVLCDKTLLATRAAKLGLSITFHDYQKHGAFITPPQHLTVLSLPCVNDVVPGTLDPANASYVMDMLSIAATRSLQGEFSALVTAPVHKAVINQAGFAFTGHTEYFSASCKTKTVVMMLASEAMRVALVTTHLPLKEVAAAVTIPLLMEVITTLHASLQSDFGIANPIIHVAGLNPHAGEGGYLGREEMEVIIPAVQALQDRGLSVHGPFSADTLFIPKKTAPCDAYVAMYHDQGLPVLKYASFGQAVNVTLGLPIIRTSVDHGTALELAGRGLVDTGSIDAAVEMAMVMAQKKDAFYAHH